MRVRGRLLTAATRLAYRLPMKAVPPAVLDGFMVLMTLVLAVGGAWHVALGAATSDSVKVAAGVFGLLFGLGCLVQVKREWSSAPDQRGRSRLARVLDVAATGALVVAAVASMVNGTWSAALLYAVFALLVAGSVPGRHQQRRETR